MLVVVADPAGHLPESFYILYHLRADTGVLLHPFHRVRNKFSGVMQYVFRDPYLSDVMEKRRKPYPCYGIRGEKEFFGNGFRYPGNTLRMAVGVRGFGVNCE